MRYAVRCLKRGLFALTILPIVILFCLLGVLSVPFCFLATGEALLWSENLEESLYLYYEWATGKQALGGDAAW
jgi:hypothetical protein